MSYLTHELRNALEAFRTLAPIHPAAPADAVRVEDDDGEGSIPA